MYQYLYMYLHPEHGYLYCGRASNLSRRIWQHANKKDDNIPREYVNLLNESVIMYIELPNKAEVIAAEAYCINKFKPFLNTALKYDDKPTLEMKLPEWKVYNVRKENSKNKTSIFELNIKDIIWFYKNCDGKYAQFYTYGEEFSGIIEYDRFLNRVIINCYLDNTVNSEYQINIEDKKSIDLMNKYLPSNWETPYYEIFKIFYKTLLHKKSELSISDVDYQNDQIKEKQYCEEQIAKYKEFEYLIQ